MIKGGTEKSTRHREITNENEKREKITQNIKWMKTATTNTSRVNTQQTYLICECIYNTHFEMIYVIEKFPFHSYIYI